VSATKAGVTDALVEIDSELAGTGPSAVGVSVSEMMQFEFPARVLPQVVEATEYSAGGVMELIVNDDGPRLMRETEWMGLMAPTTTLPKASDEAETETAVTPVPFKAAVTGLLVALVATVSVDAGTAPMAVGVSVSAILQVPPNAAIGVEVEQVVEGSSV
jgi:hypothetical protein